MGGVVLGSTSAALVHHADRPLLVVPEDGARRGGPVLVGYDGSDGAKAAIGAAGRLLAGRPAVVVHAWRSPRRHGAGAAALGAALPEVARDLEEAFASTATDVAAEGARLAREAGLEAEPAAAEGGAPPWRLLAEAAAARGAAVVVTGSRGLGQVSSALLGSVSSRLVHAATVPVLVVPPET